MESLEGQSEGTWKEVTVAFCSGDLQYQEARKLTLLRVSLSLACSLDTQLLKGEMDKMELLPPGGQRWDAHIVI